MNVYWKFIPIDSVASCLQNILNEGKFPSVTMLAGLIMIKLPDIRWTFSSRSNSLNSSRQPSALLLCFPEKGLRRPVRIESWTRKWHPKRPPSKDSIECGSRLMKLVRRLDERCFWIVAFIRKAWWKICCRTCSDIGTSEHLLVIFLV